MNLLTADELNQLHLIIENAHREGWINADATLAAEHTGSSVRVIATRGSNVVEKTYPGDARWTFRLLRDLAWGAYSVKHAAELIPPAVAAVLKDFPPR